MRICDVAGAEVARLSGYLGQQTNNHAEYCGLIAALRWAAEQGIDAFEVRSDSQLMVRQMLGQYRVKSPTLKPLWEEARALAAALPRFRIRHLRRENNVDADSLANQVLDQRVSAPS